MPAFHFQLEKVLKVREHQTALAQHGLAAAQSELGRARAALDQVRHLRSAWVNQWEQRRSERMAALEWSAASERLAAFAEAERKAVQHLHGCLADVAARRQELEEATQAQKTLEQLREKQKEEHMYAVLAAEQSQIDEMAQTMRGHRRGDGHP